MSQNLDSITACNQHEPFLGPFQYGGTASISTRNITGRKTFSGRDPSGIRRYISKKLRGQGNGSLRTATFYRTVSPEQGEGPGSIYSQHLTLFNTKNRRIFTRQGFIHDIKEIIDKWKASGNHTFLMGDFNDYILSQIFRWFFAKLDLRELITQKHR